MSYSSVDVKDNKRMAVLMRRGQQLAWGETVVSTISCLGIRTKSGASLKTRLRLPFVVVCAVPAFAEVAQDAAAEQLDASASAVIRRQLHLSVSCNVDKAAVHLVSRKGA